MSFGTNKIVKTRHPHRCFSCLRKFEAGTLMDKWSWFHDGDGWCSGYTCMTCDEIHDLHKNDFDYGEGIPEGYVNECLEKDQTPEEYLNQLKLTTLPLSVRDGAK